MLVRMASDTDKGKGKGNGKDGQAAREEFEVAYYTKELGRPLQRKLLQRRFNEFSDGNGVSAASNSIHGEEKASREGRDEPPREDRAG